jgi:arabinose-5-phosphate isomerase
MSTTVQLREYQLPTPLDSACSVLRSEADALMALAQSLGEDFEQAVYTLETKKGKVVVTGIGKSGHIARKISSTFASTGTHSIYVHPAEASHGDLGMIGKDDAVLALSNSGNTKELSDIIHYCRRFSIPLIGMTSDANSFLAQHADVVLKLPQIPEACPMRLAPTTSTTMMLALGDALAVVLLERQDFSTQDFKLYHPGGQLGHALLKVEDLMHSLEEAPLVSMEEEMSDLLIEMSSKNFGCVGVINDSGALLGIITDGDLRRHIHRDLLKAKATDVMTPSPKTIGKDALVAEAMALMNNFKITALFVTDKDKPVGILHIHDCLRMERQSKE